MRGRNARDTKPRTAPRRGGAMGRSRRVRGPAAHRDADRAATCKTLSVCYLLSRAPRWRAATGKGAGCQAAHRAVARRRDGDIAPYRNGTRAVRGEGAPRDVSMGAMRGCVEEGGRDATAGRGEGAQKYRKRRPAENRNVQPFAKSVHFLSSTVGSDAESMFRSPSRWDGPNGSFRWQCAFLAFRFCYKRTETS